MNCPDCLSDDLTFEARVCDDLQKYRCNECGLAFGRW